MFAEHRNNMGTVVIGLAVAISLATSLFLCRALLAAFLARAQRDGKSAE